MNEQNIDILEEYILNEYGCDVFEMLLREHALEEDDKRRHIKNRRHIYWATDNYENKGFRFADQIRVESVTGKNKYLVRPRAVKTKEEQEKRTREKAEVFTPAWVCNAQNNLIDEAWFGQPNVFNSQDDTNHVWQPTEGKISFPTSSGRTWQDYVCDTRLEMACGEAPYLVSRYDTTTGNPIPLNMRIGLFDRKMRVVSENVKTMKDWYQWAFAALKSTYGFEWQGDNLLLAREAMFCSFIDYYKAFASKIKLKTTKPFHSYLLLAARIISWNIFQMDGIKMVLPMTCNTDPKGNQKDLFTYIGPCVGCKKNDVHQHNGIYQVVADWDRTKWKEKEQPIEIVEFHTMINK